MQPSFKLTAKQVEANALLGSQATHIMLYGGSRSGKTALLVRAMLTRALAYKSRHVVLRYRFNHLKSSIIYDTLPKIMDLCFPGVADSCHLDKTDWFYRLPNLSEIWFGGLDDKERTEKILGNEYATILFNECSQIPWSSRNTAITRLAQNTPLRLKAYYDANPPSSAHWTKRIFIDKVSPDSKERLQNPENYAALLMNPAHNLDNLPQEYIDELEGLPERLKRRFLYGQFTNGIDGALWAPELLDACRVLDGEIPDIQRLVIAIDPSGCSGPEDVRSDEIGIVVGGLGTDGRAYVLEDLSGKLSPQQWGNLVVQTFSRWRADAVVAESNFGGAMVKEVIRAACSEAKHPMLPFKMVHASRGKVVRAEPVAALYGSLEKIGKVSHVGRFPMLEDQMVGMTTSGYRGEKSPDRADALVWLLTELFPALSRPEKKHYTVPIERNNAGAQGWLS